MKSKYNLIAVSVIGLSICLYIPVLSHYFFSDDWFHFRVSQINSFLDFLNFFSFNRVPYGMQVYRPVSTLLFFSVMKLLFGLWFFPYGMIGLLLHGLNLGLVYKLCQKLFQSCQLAIVALITYAFSATHIYRLFFISAYQEIFMSIFVLLSILFYLKQKVKVYLPLSIISFLLALGSKETAIATLPLIISMDCLQRKFQWKKWLLFTILTIIFLYLRLSVFGTDKMDPSYNRSYTISDTAKTLEVYSLWLLGIPEYLQGLKDTLVHLSSYYFHNNIYPSVVFLFLVLSISLMVLFATFSSLVKRRKPINLIVFSIVWIFFSLSPVLFMPNHRFILQSTLALFGFSTLISSVYYSFSSYFRYLLVSLYVSAQLISLTVTWNNHNVLYYGSLSKQLIVWLQNNYPNKPQQPLLFLDDRNSIKDTNHIYDLESTTWGSELFKTFYNDSSFIVYFQDKTGKQLLDMGSIPKNTITIPLSRLERDIPF